MDWYKSPARARKWAKKQIIDGTAGFFEGTMIGAIIWLVGDISFTSKGVGRTLGAAALTCSEPRVPEDDQMLKIINKES